jgi:hypothetical protein
VAISVSGTVSRRKSVSPPTTSTELDCCSGAISIEGRRTLIKEYCKKALSWLNRQLRSRRSTRTT